MSAQPVVEVVEVACGREVRCPECDYALMLAPASSVLMKVGGAGVVARVLRPVDVIYCDRCGWCRFATANDHGVLDVLLRRRHRTSEPAPSGIKAHPRTATEAITQQREREDWTGDITVPAGSCAHREGFNAGLTWVRERFNLDAEDVVALDEAIEAGPWE